LLRNLHRRRKKLFIFIYEVFVKQKKKKRSTNHYSPLISFSLVFSFFSLCKHCINISRPKKITVVSSSSFIHDVNFLLHTVLAKSRRFNQTGQPPPGGIWPKENFWEFDTVDF
jgi:hypothetical protein